MADCGRTGQRLILGAVRKLDDLNKNGAEMR